MSPFFSAFIFIILFCIFMLTISFILGGILFPILYLKNNIPPVRQQPTIPMRILIFGFSIGIGIITFFLSNNALESVFVDEYVTGPESFYSYVISLKWLLIYFPIVAGLVIFSILTKILFYYGKRKLSVSEN